jgi:hypothetical protein
MHAILGMAASHLELLAPSTPSPTAIHSLSKVALTHRLAAISGCSTFLSRKHNRTGSDNDALFATHYLLAFQSSYLPDGVEEYLPLIRTCNLLRIQLQNDGLPMAFFLPGRIHWDIMEKRLAEVSVPKRSDIQDAEESLKRLKIVFTDQGSLDNLQLWRLMIKCVDAMRVDSISGKLEP